MLFCPACLYKGIFLYRQFKPIKVSKKLLKAYNGKFSDLETKFQNYIEHVLHYLEQIGTYQVTDWSGRPRTSAFPHDILDTIFLTSLSDTN